MTRFRPLLALSLLLAFALPAPAADPSDGQKDEVRRMVDGLRADAARIRGLEWRYEVPADLLSRDQLKAKILQSIEEEIEPEELERDTRIARRLGMLGPDEDPVEMMTMMMGEMVAGFYDPTEKHLYLIEGMVGDAQKPVIFHELIHALEDQYVDLEERTKDLEDDPDRLFAEQCVVEGSAEHARALFQDEHPGLAEAYAEGQQDPEMSRKQMAVIAKVPAWMMVGTLLHYDVGPKLVARYVGDDYPNGMARLYAYGPVTEEQLLHPARYLAAKQDYPRKISFPENLAERAGDGWKKYYELTTGELDLALYLDFFLGVTKGKLNPLLLMQGKYYGRRATEAARGWDGGRSLFLEKADRPLAWVEAYAFDTVKDATEAMDALKDARTRAGNGFELIADASKQAEGEQPLARTIDYTTSAGRGRLYQSGLRVLLLDGVDERTMGALWPSVLETTFEKDPRDTWDPENPPDPLAGLDLVDAKRTVGLDLPPEWTSAKPDNPQAVLGFRKGDVRGELVAKPVPADLGMIRPLLEAQLPALVPGFDPETRTTAEVGGTKGYRYDAGSEEEKVRVYLGVARGTLLLFFFRAGPDAIDAAAPDLEALTKSVVVAEE